MTYDPTDKKKHPSRAHGALGLVVATAVAASGCGDDPPDPVDAATPVDAQTLPMDSAVADAGTEMDAPMAEIDAQIPEDDADLPDGHYPDGVRG